MFFVVVRWYAQLYDRCGVVLFDKGVFLLYEMVAAQLYDMCCVLLLVFFVARW